MHNNNLFVKKYTLFYWILRVHAGPEWSAAVRRKRTRTLVRVGPVRSALETLPMTTGLTCPEQTDVDQMWTHTDQM